MTRLRQDLILVGSFLTTCLVIGNAFYHKKQFYPSVVHITKSNGSMAVS
jgi:E3 ubiquitin-protein ligase synoviolin